MTPRRPPHVRAAAWIVAIGVAPVFVLACSAVLAIPDVPGAPPDAADSQDSSLLEGSASLDASSADHADATAQDARGDAPVADSTFDRAVPADAASADAFTADVAHASDAGTDARPDTGTVCTDTQSDPHNCGSCSHDCLGGACSSGLCQPVAILGYDAGINPWGLAQDDTSLYWTDLQQGTINRTHKVDGGIAVLTDQAVQPLPIAVDGTTVYWGDSNAIWRCATTGCQPSPQRVADAFQVIGAFAVDPTNDGVYWAEQGPQVFHAHKLGSGQTGTPFWDGGANVARLATDGQRVYFTADDGVLHALAVDGGAGLTIGTPNDAGSFGVTYDQGVVYWTIENYSAGLVMATTTSSLAAIPLAASQRNPMHIASDGTSLYWVNQPYLTEGAVQIMTCPLSSCAATALAKGFNVVDAIVVDSRAIYWTERYSVSTSTGAIWKLAK